MAAYPNERLDTFSGDAITEFFANVALGQIPDSEIVYIYGHAPAIAGGSTSVLWPLDGELSASSLFPTTAVQAYISSSSLSDTAVSVRLKVIDSDWNVQYITTTLSGRTAIALPLLVRRVINIENVGAVNSVGNVYVGTQASPTLGVPTMLTTLNMYTAEHQVSHTGIYTVPAGYTLLVYEFGGGTPTNDSALINASYSNPTTTVFKVGMQMPVYRGHDSQKAAYFPLPEKTDLYLSVRAYTNNTEANGFIFGALVKNHYKK